MKKIFAIIIIVLLALSSCSSFDQAEYNAQLYSEMSEYDQGVAAVQAHSMFWVISAYLAWVIIGR